MSPAITINVNPLTLPDHEAAAMFPMMSEDEIRALAGDIKVHGLRHPVTLVRSGDGFAVLDGRNRIRACELIGDVPRYSVHDGEPISFVLSTNLSRRHLSESQRTMVGARAKALFEDAARHRQEATRSKPGEKVGKVVANLPPPSDAGKAREKAALLVNVSPRSIESGARVLRHGTEALVKAVESGVMAVSVAEKLAVQSTDTQLAAIERAKSPKPAPGSRAGRIVSLENEKKIHGMHLEGKGTVAIAEAIGISKTAVSKAKTQLGVSNSSSSVKLWSEISHFVNRLDGSTSSVDAWTDSLDGAALGADAKETASCSRKLNRFATAIRRLSKALVEQSNRS